MKAERRAGGGRRATALGALLCAAAWSAAGLSAPLGSGGGASVRGEVLDPAGVGRAALVTAQRIDPPPVRTRQVRADPDGSFRIEALAPGTWEFSAVSGSLRTGPRGRRLHVGPGETSRVVLGLRPPLPVEGRVTDRTSGRGVPARVTAISPTARAQTRSSADGSFRFEDLAYALDLDWAGDDEEVVFLVEAEGRRPSDRSVPVGSLRRAKRVELTAGPRGAVLSGRLVGPAGVPLRGVPVWARAGALVAAARTDGNGRFRFEGLPPGRFLVEPAHRVNASIGPAEALVPLQAAAVAQLDEGAERDLGDLAYGPGATIWGRLIAAGGDAPPAGLFVEVRHPLWAAPERLEPDEHGRFAFPPLGEGVYALRVGREGPFGERTLIETEARPGPAPIALTLPEEPDPVRIEISLVARGDSRPIEPPVRVETRPAGAPAWVAPAVRVLEPDDRGAVTVDLPEPGLWRFVLAAEGYAAVGFEMPFSAGAPVRRAALSLPRAASVSGRVEDPDGRPVAGARVFLRPFDAPIDPLAAVSVTSDERGAFRAALCTAPFSRLVALAPGFAPAEAPSTRPGAIRLTTGAPVGGTLRLPGGAPAAARTLLLRGRLVLHRTVTNAEGRFLFPHVEEGPFSLEDATGREIGSGEVVEGDPLDVDIEL